LARERNDAPLSQNALKSARNFTGADKTMNTLETLVYGQEKKGGSEPGRQTEEDFGEAMHLRRAGMLALDASLAQTEPADWQTALQLA
jgi:hypothetical protein